MCQTIVLLSPEPAAATETFIRAHRDNLPFLVIELYRWRFPYKTGNGQWIGLAAGVLRLLAEYLRLDKYIFRLDRWGQKRVAQWLRETHASALVAEYGPLGAGIATACRMANIPLVVIFHGFDAYMNDTLERYRYQYSQLFATAAALVVVSEPMRKQLIELGAPPERIQVNPCGVDPSRFCNANPAIAGPQFLTIGRFVGKKGPLITIEAFARVHQVEPSCRLTMIGTGPLLLECERRVSELGLDHAINFAGVCSHTTVQKMMHQARAVVQHSLRCSSGDQEGTPVALIEAQMAGVPVVATYHAGIPAVVLDRRTGFLVHEGDVVGMAEAMLRLAQDPKLAGQLGAAARAHALQHHTMDRHINSLATTINDAICRSKLMQRT